jgi:hypothetical protein
MNPKAKDRLELDYSIAGYPSCFFDGGSEVYVGAPVDATPFRALIEQCGARPVTPLNLITAVDFIDTTNIRIRVAIGYEVPANSPPAVPVMLSGVHQSRPGESYQFTARSTDAELDSLRYQYDWGDGIVSGWLGPYANSVAAAASHSWAGDGTFSVRVRARDPWDEITGWSTLWNVNVSSSCCTGPSRGNVDGSADNLVTMGDLTVLIDNLFISLSPLACVDAGNVDLSSDNLVTMGDLTVMIDNLFISLSPLPPCP